MTIGDVRGLDSEDVGYVTKINEDAIGDLRDEALSSEYVVAKRFVLIGYFAGFRFGRFRWFFIIGGIDFIRRGGGMEGTCLADGRGIFFDLDREAIDEDGGRSDTIRLDDANGRILGVINITKTIGIDVIAIIDFVLGIDDIGYSAAFSFFEHLVSIYVVFR